MKRWLVFALVAVAVSACSAAASGEELVVKEPWVRPSPMAAGNGAGYMVIQNKGATDDALIGAEADFAEAVEIHETFTAQPEDMAGTGGEGGESMGGEMMGMRPVQSVPVPAGGEAVLQPGGYHIMFIGVTQTLEPGSKVTLTLVFESGKRLQIEAEVRAQ